MSGEKKILIVDDDLVLREMYETRLKADGFVIVAATDGEEALEKVAKEKPDLILLDVMMPKINGIDVMKKLREDSSTANIPIILLTALVKEIDKIKEMMRDSDGYLIKSEIMPGQVVDKIKEILAKVANSPQASPPKPSGK